MIKLTRNQIMICSSVAVISITAAVITYLYFNYMNKKKMSISGDGLALIKRLEGLRYNAYQCSAGVWTIGYGHTKGVKEGDTCTLSQAGEWLLEDVAEAEDAVNSQHLNLKQNQFDALVSFVFNVGVKAFKDSTLLKKIKTNPNDPDISKEFANWKYAAGNVVKGLVNRRKEEINLYFA